MTKFVEANPSKRKDMPKRGRGRPPKAQSAKSTFTSNKIMKYEDLYDVNVRRESYNDSLLKSEPSSPKQLQPGNGGITYRESLMKFCKDLGPTARKIALRKLLGQGVNYQTRHQLQPLLPSLDVNQPHSRFLDLNSTNSSVRIATPNQASQPLMGFGDYKGKRIMVDDGKSNFNKRDVGDNLEFLLGKQKTGVQICKNYQQNGGDGSSENQDLVCKNLGYGQVGSWMTINQIGSLLSNYNGNLNKNINNVNGIEDVEGAPRNKNINSCVHPSTYVQPSKKIFSSSFAMNDIPWVPPPSTPVAPLQKWWLQPPETKNLVLNDGLCREPELELALASYMQTSNQQPKVWIENSWAQNQPSQFHQSNLHGTYQQQQPQPHQFLSYQNVFNNDDSQLQERLLMPIPPKLWSQTEMFGVVPKQDSFPFVCHFAEVDVKSLNELLRWPNMLYSTCKAPSSPRTSSERKNGVFIFCGKQARESINEEKLNAKMLM
ncbi:unnamed protein product [Lactuca saligna]|uniref:Uncharacterized protein n=1 Tax=Lactuca saligna TaxID=75948 RepID=A0AA36EJR1_LACSI|nr:unnamed protein product [Lactuca saligna]